ncbi:alpha/beta fold hydrolase [Leptospira sp. GIMC2001]|uniref:alpha/beta fold hydrolase n=1 Tax=Leptospira sp. GIMC2001 TaxID=1513297 RepID=UPI0023492B67|nr:alpha/beta fold hydrolase [Leptospira sp. GIMC2001]WCL50226.1 alpha/beta fold hydrolase [Leptospira sp. GIMC2001]
MSLFFKLYFNNSEVDSPEFIKTSKHPIVILHGLFGSSKNWVSVAKNLSKDRLVYSLDLRNHGNSPHYSSHTLNDMVEDLREFLIENNILKPIVLGHSMGGLVAMLYFLKSRSELGADVSGRSLADLCGIIIQDIAPRHYQFQYEREVEAMSLDVSKANSRQEIDNLMKEIVPNTFIRQFLLMNLERKEIQSPNESNYYWKLNLPAIVGDRKLFSSNFELFNPVHDSGVLFMLGSNSEYMEPQDRPLMQKFFPNATIVEIEGGGHYIHYTHANEFISNIMKWLELKNI